jgi:hypothetical protein
MMWSVINVEFTMFMHFLDDRLRASPRMLPVGMILFLVLGLAGGCASKPPLTHSGFLEDYSKLTTVDDSLMLYVSPQLKSYNSFMIDPIEFTVPPKKLTPEGRAEVARYFRSKLVEVLKSRGFSIAEDTNVGVARVQIAMTDVANSTWWMKVHPAARLSGAGTGGASCEGEIIDAVTGEQLAAWIKTSSGSQFDILAWSTVADVKSAIDKWANDSAKRLEELKKSSPPAQ